nr:uncharacterized protein LOC121470859 [Taeniopygia guttata]
MHHVLPSRFRPLTEKPQWSGTIGEYCHRASNARPPSASGFELREDKIQKMPPWKYLGLEITKRTITPQKLAIKNKIRTLADVQQLCGSLNWVRPWLGITNRDLNAPGLVRQFHLTRDQARAIVATCPSCKSLPLPSETQESFVSFVDRLYKAAESQVPEDGLRQGMVKQIALQNANEACRQAMLSLPLDPEPTLQDMLDVLALTEPLLLRDSNWHFVTVDTQDPGTWRKLHSKYIVLGDTKYTPLDITIAPNLTPANPKHLVLWLHCAHPPVYLPKGQIIAQAIPVSGAPVYPEDLWRKSAKQIYEVCQAQVIGKDRPKIECYIWNGGEHKWLNGLLDTGADVTVIPSRDWPSRWELQDVAGHIQGVGGAQLAKQSKNIIKFEGPNRQTAYLRPFVLDYTEPLWGRDLMARGGVSLTIPTPQVFRAAVTEERPTQKLNWLSDVPIWVEQWPLNKQKLKALQKLVAEQLAKGHIQETTSPWNSPIFVLKKPGKDEWRLLHDLRAINNVIENMGPLQPGMPSPTMLPKDWELAVIDIKNCFFHIPLHPDDAPRFAFSVPSLNREAPMERYHWRVLPQGLKCSPTICQRVRAARR